MNHCPEDAKSLRAIIEQYDAISFDVWDTLITRAVLFVACHIESDLNRKNGEDIWRCQYPQFHKNLC